ncbi:MAG: hypothetical protein ACYTFO_09220 [Planctomycetota bacterium]|jgi:hypothetical protein
MIGFVINILAEGEGDGIGALIAVVVLAVIGLIGKVVTKVKEANARREEIRRGPLPKKEPAEDPSGELPVNAREAMARAALKSMGIVAEPEAPSPPPRPKLAPRRRAPVAAAPTRTSMEPMGPVVESTVDDHVEEHILAGIRKKVAEPVEQTKVTVDLSSPNRLREAIVLHEILAAPKSIRKESALWDSA